MGIFGGRDRSRRNSARDKDMKPAADKGFILVSKEL
jgi:hypothetical protein